MACLGCDITLHKFLLIISNKNVLLEFLISHGVINETFDCPSCGSSVDLDNDSLTFHCNKESFSSNFDGDKKRKITCSFSKSVLEESWFSRSTFCTESSASAIEKICLIASYFLFLNPPRTTFIQEETGWSADKIKEWYICIRDVFVNEIIVNNKPIGGPSTIVEIDEAEMGKWINNKGRAVKGQWVLGGIQRDSKDCFLVPFEKRNATTLLRVLEANVLPGTTIISDCSQDYELIDKDKFDHFTVNHKVNFVDPDTGAHTQTMRRCWREVKQVFPKNGKHKQNHVGYLAEYLWKRKHARTDRLHDFFISVGKFHQMMMSNPILCDIKEEPGNEVEIMDSIHEVPQEDIEQELVNDIEQIDDCDLDCSSQVEIYVTSSTASNQV